MENKEIVEKKKSTQYIETVRANSFCFRYGGVGTDSKIYFDDVSDLKAGITAVIDGAKHLQELLNENKQGGY